MPKPGKRRWYLEINCGSKLASRSRGYLYLEAAAVRRHRLLAVAVAAITSLLVAIEMMIHLGVQNALGEHLLQVVDQAIRGEDRLRIGTRQKLVDDCVRNNRFFASSHGKLDASINLAIFPDL